MVYSGQFYQPLLESVTPQSNNGKSLAHAHVDCSCLCLPSLRLTRPTTGTITACIYPQVCLLPSALGKAAGDISEKEVGCGAGQHLFGESCFWVSSSNLYTWGQGEDECTLRGMQLASLSSQEEHDFLWGEICWNVFFKPK